MRRLRYTVSNKIAVGLGVILVIGLLCMFAIYNGLRIVDKDIHQLAHFEEPAVAAAHEMEININELGFAVLNYLDSHNPRYRAWIAKDQSDFEKFHARYLQVTNISEETRLGSMIGTVYQRFKHLGETLMNRVDEQQTFFAALTRNIEKIDDLIDEQIQPFLNPQDPHALAKTETVLDMEAEVADLGFWVANYQRVQKEEYRRQILDERRDFQRALTRFEALQLAAEEMRSLQLLEDLFEDTGVLAEKILALEDYLQENIGRYVQLRIEMDGILDEKIQVLALKDLYAPRIEAGRAMESTLRTILYLIPLYVLATIAVGLLLIRLINRPLSRLMAGTDAIGRRDLDYRINLPGADEFTDLAKHFNRMVDQLQATTVSKESLEASETKLQATVFELRHEIAERERAEQAQAKLQAELRRSETMSAMGSLVAGVAHEVRNPLFSISSTLDAMNVCFADREELQEYNEILREETDRLTRLMTELLEYGKPPTLEFAPGAISDVIEQAMQVCQPLAERAQIKIDTRLPADIPELRTDRMRLAQVFQNLLQNAIQHAPRGSSVSIEAQEVQENAARWIVCTVKDAGKGLAAADSERIFDPFFTRRRGGTGLGLAIVRRIVEEHGGMVSAANRSEGGAIMTVRLPLSPAVALSARCQAPKQLS